jgi:hypothetical protein
VKTRFNSLAWLVLFFVPVVILFCGVRSRHNREVYLKENSHASFAKHNQEVVSEWKSYDYMSFTNFAEVKRGVKFLIETNTNASFIPDDQKEALAQEIIKFFRAYSAGDYDSYCQFRFPAGVTWTWKTNGCGYVKDQTGAEAELERYFRYGPIFGPPPFLYNFRTNFGYYPSMKITRRPPVGMDARFKEYVFQYSDCTFYSNFWTGVSLDRSKLVITRATNSLSKLSQVSFYPMQQPKCATMSRPFPNLGYEESTFGCASLLDFDNNLSTVISKYGETFVANAFFFINTSHPDVPFPILVRFYWSPTDQQWLPNEVVIGTLQTLVLRYPVF